MGGTTSQTISNINTSISKNILNSLQTQQNNINISQKVSGYCDIDKIKQISTDYVNCITDTVKQQQWPNDDDLLKICGVITSQCKMNDININSVINLSNISTQENDVKQSVTTAIKNTLSQYGGSEADQYITQATKSVSTTTNNIIQQLTNNETIRQTISTIDGSVSVISLDLSVNIVNNVLQKDSNLQSAVTSISNSISQVEIDNESSIFTTFLIVGCIIIISGIMIKLIMILKRSSSMSDFFNNILPGFIWFILALVTTLLHILKPPKYITYQDSDNITRINKKYLFLFLLAYYTGFAIIIIIIFYIKNYYNNNYK